MLTWNAKKEAIFEMPTGGAAIMRKGDNLLKLARKEQCLALLTQLRTKFKTDGCFYRVFPNGASKATAGRREAGVGEGEVVRHVRHVRKRSSREDGLTCERRHLSGW